MTWLRSVAPPSAGASSAVTAVAAGSRLSASTLAQSTTITGFTIVSIRSTFGQRISSAERSGTTSICVEGFGGGGATPPSSGA